MFIKRDCGDCGPTRWEVAAILISAVAELTGLWMQIKNSKAEKKDAEVETRNQYGYTLIDELEHFKTECRTLRGEKDYLQDKLYSLEGVLADQGIEVEFTDDSEGGRR